MSSIISQVVLSIYFLFFSSAISRRIICKIKNIVIDVPCFFFVLETYRGIYLPWALDFGLSPKRTA
jgi:hypothetical protein